MQHLIWVAWATNNKIRFPKALAIGKGLFFNLKLSSMTKRILTWVARLKTFAFSHIKNKNNSSDDPFSDNPCIIL